MKPPVPTDTGALAVLRRIDAALVAVLVSLIRGYQRWLSPLLGRQCRFHPTCSCYAADSLSRHGAIKGLALTIWRLLRCQPFAAGGFDPVPPTTAQSVTTGELEQHATH